MQQIELTGTLEGAGRERVEAAIPLLASAGGCGESLAAVAHDARNMVAALELYCDLLEAPGVLSKQFAHYGRELRLVVAASLRLVEKLMTLDSANDHPEGVSYRFEALDRDEWRARAGVPIGNERKRTSYRGWEWDTTVDQPVGNLAAEVLANRNLLAALAGPGILVTVDAENGAKAARITAEDLTRILVNLVKNAAEAMPSGGCIEIRLRERLVAGEALPRLVLSVADDGPGIPEMTLERVFESGFSLRAQSETGSQRRRAARRGLGRGSERRGLGLAITRSIVESCGGTIVASNRAQGGACFEIELPARIS